MPNLIEIKNLKVVFQLNKQNITAADGVDLNIKTNEILVLAGESGSGKTITSLAITRNLPQTAKVISGSVIFENQDLLKMEAQELIRIRGAKIAYIFQEPASFLNPVYSIGNQIAEAIMLHQNLPKKEAYLEATRLLREVKINDPQRVLLDYPHQLSGGMNQRVFIAMALACQPKLLIADEPTTSLDVTVEREILDLLLDLKRKLGFSLLFITHNLSIAKRIADSVCVMQKGKVVEVGSREKIFSQPQHLHTKELIAAYEKIGRL